MTKERRSEYVNTAINAQSRVKAKDTEAKILAPILKKNRGCPRHAKFQKISQAPRRFRCQDSPIAKTCNEQPPTAWLVSSLATDDIIVPFVAVRIKFG